MRRVVVLTDVHGNIDALEALEAELRRDGWPDALVVLGDLVDYGPAPAEVIAWIRAHATVTVRGNHDHAMATGEECHSSATFKALSVITRDYFRPQLATDALAWLGALPRQARWPEAGGATMLVHATPRDPLFEYRRKGDDEADWREALAPAGADVDTVWLGHTHVPFTRRVGHCMVVNPGSLGMPKDGDPRGCYAVWEGGQIRLVRIAYDVERAIDRIARLDLPESARLALGHVLRTGGRLPA